MQYWYYAIFICYSLIFILSVIHPIFLVSISCLEWPGAGCGLLGHVLLLWLYFKSAPQGAETNVCLAI